MAHNRRLSQQSLNGGWRSPISSSSSFTPASDSDAAEWTKDWNTVVARDLIDSPIVALAADVSVEEACDLLLSENVPCLVVNGEAPHGGSLPNGGLFDYSDVNAFLTLAATRHTFSLDNSEGNIGVAWRNKIIEAATAGNVPVSLVSNLSDKNPSVILDYDATIIAVLEVFARGTHRVLIRSRDNKDVCIGMVSDRGLLSWFASYAKSNTSFRNYLSNALQSLPLPSFNAHASVIAAFSSATILDAMMLMCEEGVSSIAVLDEESGVLLSTVSVTDVGKIVVPSQSNQFLNTPLHQFISYIKQPDGSTDGADKYPVYSVSPSSQLLYTVEKILATNAHRVFVARESTSASPVLGPAATGNLCGIVSIVDILALFAKLAGITKVDPTEMQRHRRQSSTSSQGSRSMESLTRSRSNSASATASVRRSPSIILSPTGIPPLDPTTSSSIPGIDSLQLPISTIIPERRKSVRTNNQGNPT